MFIKYLSKLFFIILFLLNILYISSSFEFILLFWIFNQYPTEAFLYSSFLVGIFLFSSTKLNNIFNFSSKVKSFLFLFLSLFIKYSSKLFFIILFLLNILYISSSFEFILLFWFFNQYPAKVFLYFSYLFGILLFSSTNWNNKFFLNSKLSIIFHIFPLTTPLQLSNIISWLVFILVILSNLTICLPVIGFPSCFNIKYSVILSSTDFIDLIIPIVLKNGFPLISSSSKLSIKVGINTCAIFFSPHIRNILPTHWTISIVLWRSSTKHTESIIGIFTPSFNTRAVHNTPILFFVKSFINLLRFVILVFPLNVST